MHLTSKQQKLLKWFGYPILAIVVFFFSLAYTFPYDRLKDKIIEGVANSYDANIVSIEPTLIPGTFVIKMMTLRTRPKLPNEKPVTLFISEAEVNIGVISAMMWSMGMGSVNVEIDAKIGNGSIELLLEHEKSTNTVALNGKVTSLSLLNIPGVAEGVGLPMAGALSADVALTLPSGKWSDANGSLKLNCLGCSVGDGVARMKMKAKIGASKRMQELAAQREGLTVPRINLGIMDIDIQLENGKGIFKSFDIKSPDGFLSMEGEIQFKDPFKDTTFPGCMKFGLSDRFNEREPDLAVAIEAMLSFKSKQEDGSFAIPTKGRLVDLRFDIRKTCDESKLNKSPSSATPKTKRATRTRQQLDIVPTPKKFDTVEKSEPKKFVPEGPPARKPLEGMKMMDTPSGPDLSPVTIDIDDATIIPKAERPDDEDSEEESEDSESEDSDSESGADDSGEDGRSDDGEEPEDVDDVQGIE